MIWIFYALMSAVAAALVAIFGKIGISKVDSTLATAVRAVVMALLLVVFALALNKEKLIGTIDRHAMWFIFLSGLAGAISWLFYFLALKNGPVSAVAAIDRTSVVIVFILAVLVLGQKFEWRTALGAGLVVGGAILMSLK